MTTLTVSRAFRERIFRKVQSHVEKAADQAAQKTLTFIFQTTDVEDGHAHRAWLQSGVEAIGPLAQSAFDASGIARSRLSDDPKAVAAGRGVRTVSRLHCEILLCNGLDFVKVLEFGGVIEPIGPGGKKLNPVFRPPAVGPLYGERSPTGKGIIVWRDNAGQTHKALRRKYSAGRHVGRAIRGTRKWLKSRGVR